MAMNGHVWPCMAIHGHAWPYMAIYGHVWPCMAIYGHVGPCMAIHGHAGPCMAIHGQAWPYMAMYGHNKDGCRCADLCRFADSNSHHLNWNSWKACQLQLSMTIVMGIVSTIPIVADRRETVQGLNYAICRKPPMCVEKPEGAKPKFLPFSK